jgi:hypothetical protein
MNPYFRHALEERLIKSATLPNGQSFFIDTIQYYEVTESGMNLFKNRFHAFTDTLRRHDSLKLNDELLTTSLSIMRDQLRTALAQINRDTVQVMDNLASAINTLERLQQRREFALDVAEVFDIVSVFYLSEEEDPRIVDPVVNRRKINHWIQHTELYPQFLRLQIDRFVPLKELTSPQNLEKLQSMNDDELIDLSIIQKKAVPFELSDETKALIGDRMSNLKHYQQLIDDMKSGRYKSNS